MLNENNMLTDTGIFLKAIAGFLISAIIIVSGPFGGLAGCQAFELEADILQRTRPPANCNPAALPITCETYRSKIGASLAFLMSAREFTIFPEQLREIIAADTVKVRIRFAEELSASKVRSLENLGVEFYRLDGSISHLGTVYGAKVPWNKVNVLSRMDDVIRIESAWQPVVKEPAK